MFAHQNALETKHGLEGTIVIEVKNHGVFTGMDSRIGFRYNPECAIDEVNTALGPKDGEVTITLRGSYLGMGDEMVTVNGVTKPDSGLTTRDWQGSNLKLLRVRMPTASLGETLKPKRVEVTSRRNGKCIWTPQGTEQAVEAKKASVPKNKVSNT